MLWAISLELRGKSSNLLWPDNNSDKKEAIELEKGNRKNRQTYWLKNSIPHKEVFSVNSLSNIGKERNFRLNQQKLKDGMKTK